MNRRSISSPNEPSVPTSAAVAVAEDLRVTRRGSFYFGFFYFFPYYPLSHARVLRRC